MWEVKPNVKNYVTLFLEDIPNPYQLHFFYKGAYADLMKLTMQSILTSNNTNN